MRRDTNHLFCHLISLKLTVIVIDGYVHPYRCGDRVFYSLSQKKEKNSRSHTLYCRIDVAFPFLYNELATPHSLYSTAPQEAPTSRNGNGYEDAAPARRRGSSCGLQNLPGSLLARKNP